MCVPLETYMSVYPWKPMCVYLPYNIFLVCVCSLETNVTLETPL